VRRVSHRLQKSTARHCKRSPAETFMGSLTSCEPRFAKVAHPPEIKQGNAGSLPMAADGPSGVSPCKRAERLDQESRLSSEGRMPRKVRIEFSGKGETLTPSCPRSLFLPTSRTQLSAAGSHWERARRFTRPAASCPLRVRSATTIKPVWKRNPMTSTTSPGTGPIAARAYRWSSEVTAVG